MINHYPAYLMFSPVLFRLGMAYERLTSLEMFQGLRATILCVFEKDQAQGAANRREGVAGERKLSLTRT